MRSLTEVVTELGIGSDAEILRWIEAECIRPEAAGGSYRFQQIDVARLRLIRELDEELALDRDAIPVVMGLLDQLYDLRRRVRALAEALAHEDEAVRRKVLARYRAHLMGEAASS